MIFSRAAFGRYGYLCSVETSPDPVDFIFDLMPHCLHILIFDRTADMLLVAVHHSLLPAHPRPGEKLHQTRRATAGHESPQCPLAAACQKSFRP